MEVWLRSMVGFDFPNARTTICGAGENPISWISLGDVGAFAVHALGSPEAENATIEPGGPEALGPNQVVRIFESAVGRAFEVPHVPVEALEQQRATAPDPYSETFASLMLGYAAGDPIPMEETLQRFPVPLTSVREYASRVLSVPVPPSPAS